MRHKTASTHKALISVPVDLATGKTRRGLALVSFTTRISGLIYILYYILVWKYLVYSNNLNMYGKHILQISNSKLLMIHKMSIETKTGLLSLCHILSDIDECSSKSSSCDHECINTVGSFNCRCLRGYRLDADRRTCLKGLLVH